MNRASAISSGVYVWGLRLQQTTTAAVCSKVLDSESYGPGVDVLQQREYSFLSSLKDLGGDAPHDGASRSVKKKSKRRSLEDIHDDAGKGKGRGGEATRKRSDGAMDIEERPGSASKKKKRRRAVPR